MKIIFNGQEYENDREFISYDEIVASAKQGPQPTITFSVKGTTKQGTLIKGQRIPVEAGLIINAMDTGNA